MLVRLNNIKGKELINFNLEYMKLEQHPGDSDRGKDRDKDKDSSINNSPGDKGIVSNRNLNNKETNKSVDIPVVPKQKKSFNSLKGKEDHAMLHRELDGKLFNPVKEFEMLLDLEYVYQIIQEVKLLELLFLNQKQSVLFFNCKNREID